MTENDLSKIIIGLATEVHNALGPGLLENVYKECLFYKFVQRNLNCRKGKRYAGNF